MSSPHLCIGLIEPYLNPDCTQDAWSRFLQVVTWAMEQGISWLFVSFAILPILNWWLNSRPWRVRWAVRVRLREILRGTKRVPLIVLASLEGTKTNHYKNMHTDIGQVRSATILAPSLTRAFGLGNEGVTALFSRDPSMPQLVQDKDVVTLGGGKNNDYSKEFLNRLEKRNGKAYTVAKVKSIKNKGEMVDVPVWNSIKKFSSESEVFGIVARLRLSKSKGTYETLIAGAGTYGTEAGAVALSSDGELNKWIRKHRSTPEFLALVTGNLSYTSTDEVGLVTDVRLIEIVPIAPKPQDN